MQALLMKTRARGEKVTLLENEQITIILDV